MREPTRPHDLVRRGELEDLPEDLALPVRAQERKDLAKVEEHVLVHGREVAGLLRERVARVQEDDLRVRVCLDEGLEVCRGGERQRDVIVAQTCMELDCRA